VRFVINKINLTDIFWIGLEWRKVEHSGELSAFIEGFVILWRPNLPSPNLSNLQTFICGMHYTPNTMVCQVENPYKNAQKM
jgi:hypothetical protein